MEDISTISGPVAEALLILLLPLTGCLIIWMLPKKKQPVSGVILSVALGVATVLSIHLSSLQWGEPLQHFRLTWFTLGGQIDFQAGVLLDNEAIIMLAVVSTISLLVCLFSMAYMKADEDEQKYFAHLGLFVFSMIGIVISSNLLVLFCFWELVGLSSYLLINHWYRNKIPPRAATKAFVVNRVGDAAFLLGIGILWAQFGTLEFTELYLGMGESNISGDIWMAGNGQMPAYMLPLLGFCLFLGASGKSAQFPFQAWLPDAMAGPTPVSALIHAATMVAAGVFLLARIFPLLALDTMTFIAFIGAITAFMGAVAAMTQRDIKKVLAFSTISQLGYMVMGMGVGAYDAALFHLFTHAFFKAGLFLAAGAVIYAMHDLTHGQPSFDPQDMRTMGGLRKRTPLLFWSFIVLSLALVGIPFFSGFLSKEAIMSGSFAWADARGDASISLYHLVPYLALITVAMTAYYMGRQVYLVFLGKERFVSSDTSTHKMPVVMRIPVVLLAIMSLGLLWSFNPFSYESSWFFSQLTVPAIIVPDFPGDLQPILVELSENNHLLVFILSSAMILVGIGIAWVRYRGGMKHIGQKQRIFYQLSYKNWWLDDLYDKGIILPVKKLAFVTYGMDRRVIDYILNKAAVTTVVISKMTSWADRNVVDGFVHLIVAAGKFTGDVFRSFQGGNVQRYVAAAILIMIVLYWLIY